jgi:peptide-methionine (R)-S-oxide reductase
MRLPSFPTIVRTFFAFSNATFRVAPAPLRPSLRPTAKLGLPSIPFLGAFFGTSSSSDKMTYPLQKAKEEWQAQLSPGMS